MCIPAAWWGRFQTGHKIGRREWQQYADQMALKRRLHSREAKRGLSHHRQSPVPHPGLSSSCRPVDLTGLLVHLENAPKTSGYHADVRRQQDTAETCTALLHLIDSEEAAAGVASDQRFNVLIGSSFVSRLVSIHCCDGTERAESQRMVSLGISRVMNASREWVLMELVEETTLKLELMKDAARCPTCGRRRYKQLCFDLPNDVLPFAAKRNQNVCKNNGDIDRSIRAPSPYTFP
ncbi:unnamed protein product [Vitrella brassicaformis CCMP3155]|uniref:Uncharacterized protein n=1 Tax=Vitrella brassicaformis (strain CCMP3155) TaxID=1169540 RepID=A0A0G4F043_VITBC|nr:unnamed protein product [Vitrella brassicaformis CCMP3155]|eukprot:CEM04574.1 unnamed protein product [Vitrella brassicaformis CCMP3155]